MSDDAPETEAKIERLKAAMVASEMDHEPGPGGFFLIDTSLYGDRA